MSHIKVTEKNELLMLGVDEVIGFVEGGADDY